MNDLANRHQAEFWHTCLCTLPTICIHSPEMARLPPFPWDAKISFYLPLTRSFMLFMLKSGIQEKIPIKKSFFLETLSSEYKRNELIPGIS